MNANPLDRNEPSANGTSGFQTAGALVGMLLIFAGVALCAFLVIRIVGAYNSPEEFNDRLNKWEMVVSGVSGDMGQGISIEKTEPIQVGSEPADGNTSRVVHEIALPFNATRTTTLFLMIMVLAIVCRLAIALITAGGGLVSLANPFKAMYDKTMRDFAAHKSRNRSSHSSKSELRTFRPTRNDDDVV